MKKYQFNKEELDYLLSDINRVVEIFIYTHNELVKEYKENNFSYLIELFDEKINYYTFIDDAVTTYTYGYCYEFAKIMKYFFNEFNYSGNDEKNHILLIYEEKHIDIRGVLEDKLSNEKYIDEHITSVSNNYVRYARENFRKMPVVLYNELKKRFYNNLKEYLEVSLSYEKIY